MWSLIFLSRSCNKIFGKWYEETPSVKNTAVWHDYCQIPQKEKPKWIFKIGAEINKYNHDNLCDLKPWIKSTIF